MRRRLNIALGIIAIALTLLVMSQWLDNRRAALANLQTHVDSMQEQARTASALHGQLANDDAASRFVAQRKAQVPGALAILDELSRRLPDHTWLDRLYISGDRVNLQGQSAQAAGLIDLLTESQLLADPGFKGVIKADPATGKQRFYVTARLRTAPAQESHDAPEAP